MLQKLEIGIWTLEIDIEKTRAFYRQYQDKCDCTYCLNFAEACKNLDDAVKKFFDTLGIDPAKPRHLSDFLTENKDVLEYISSYHIVGRVLKGELACNPNWQNSNTFQLRNFIFAFSDDIEFTPEGITKPILQLDAVSLIPWVL